MFCLATHIADAVQVPFVCDPALAGAELEIRAYPLVELPVMSAPPPTRTLPPVQEAVAGPNAVPGFWLVLVTGVVDATLVTVAVPLAPVAPVAPLLPVAPVAPVGPAGPVGPVAPLVPLVPLVPFVPLVPLVPLLPVAPVLP